MKKGQVAYEFIMVFLFLGIGFIIWVALTSDLQENLVKTQNHEALNDFSLGLKHELYVIAQMHDGFSRVIDLPRTVNALRYNIDVQHSPLINVSNIQINSSDVDFLINFNVPRMNDSLIIGENIVIKQGNELLIKN